MDCHPFLIGGAFDRPMSSTSNATPRFANCRLRCSWPLMHSFALYGKYEQNEQLCRALELPQSRGLAPLHAPT